VLGGFYLTADVNTRLMSGKTTLRFLTPDPSVPSVSCRLSSAKPVL
jgi:hypothetical protein